MCVCLCLQSEWFVVGLPSPSGVTPLGSYPLLLVYTNKGEWHPRIEHSITIIVDTNSRHYYCCT